MSIPSSGSSSGSACAGFTPTNGAGFSISWQSPPVTFTGNTVRRDAGGGGGRGGGVVLRAPPPFNHVSPVQVSPSKSQGFGEQRSQTIAALSSPPRATAALR